jgi:KDO2-lipid IV(A) lauroyltransferase
MAKAKRWLRRRGRRMLFLALRTLARVAGFRHAATLGKAIGELEYRIAWGRSRRCARDMALALGRPAGDRWVAAQLRRAHHVNAHAGLEILSMLDRKLSAAALAEHVVLEGSEHLEAALAAGRGVILLGTHAGNGVLLGAHLAARGLPVTMVYRQSRMAPNEFLGRGYRSYGIDAILANEGIRAYGRMREAIKRGRILYVTIDQGVKRPQEGVPVRFLGKPMSMAAGPAQLARHARAPVLPLVATGCNGAWRFRIEPPLPPAPGRVAAEVERLARASERQALLHPALWSWHHRRWRKLAFDHATMPSWHEGDPPCSTSTHRP